jgi:hypothetical protein
MFTSLIAWRFSIVSVSFYPIAVRIRMGSSVRCCRQALRPLKFLCERADKTGTTRPLPRAGDVAHGLGGQNLPRRASVYGDRPARFTLN